MTFPQPTPTQLTAMAVAALAGVIRGITGFGGAMVLTPPLALLLGPRLAIPVVLLLEASSGTLLGAAGIGGPPVILYLLSGPYPVNVTRANLTLYVAFSSIAALAMLARHGILDATALASTLLLAPLYFLGVLVGARLFLRFSDKRFRQFTLVLLLTVSTFIMFA